MNSNTDSIRNAAGAYVESVAVPSYDEGAIRSRTPADPHLRPQWRRPAYAVAAILAVVLLLDGRNVVAQVENMLHAFVTVNGQMVAAGVNTVTLDQARRDMPFTVIAPAGLPAGLEEQINEIVPPNSTLSSQLVFHYSSGQSLPITITESRALPPGTQQQTLITTSTHGIKLEPPGMQAPGSSKNLVMSFRDGSTGRTIELHPITWTVDGTTILLAAPPGMLTSMQIAAIERAMR